MFFKARLIVVLAFVLCFTACGEKMSQQQLAQEFIKAVFPSPSAEFVQLDKTIKDAEESGDTKKVDEVTEQSNQLLYDTLIELCGEYADQEKLKGNGAMVTKILRMQMFAVNNKYTYTVQEVTTTKSNGTVVSYEAKVAVSIPDGAQDYFQNTSEVAEIILFGNIQFNKDNKIDFFTVEQKK